MRKNFFKTMKRSKYVLRASMAVLVGAVMMSTNGNCMAMMSSDETKIEEEDRDFVVEERSDEAKAIEDAELLYTQITKFLSKHKDVDPERFDEVCRDFMNSRTIPTDNLLNKLDFEERSKGNVILYRGIPEKEYVDEFKQGKFLISGYHDFNVRGMGIYTTTSLKCARIAYGSNNPNNVIKMFIYKDKAKILDCGYLEKLKQIITEIHADVFGRFNVKVQKRYVDSWSTYDERIFSYVGKKMRELDRDVSYEEKEKLFSEAEEMLKKENPDFSKFLEEQAFLKTSKEAQLWGNLGLLTKLMGYDALYTQDESIYSGSLGELAEEYLVVNPSFLYVLAE